MITAVGSACVKKQRLGVKTILVSVPPTGVVALFALVFSTFLGDETPCGARLHRIHRNNEDGKAAGEKCELLEGLVS